MGGFRTERNDFVSECYASRCVTCISSLTTQQTVPVYGDALWTPGSPCYLPEDDGPFGGEYGSVLCCLLR